MRARPSERCARRRLSPWRGRIQPACDSDSPGFTFAGPSARGASRPAFVAPDVRDQHFRRVLVGAVARESDGRSPSGVSAAGLGTVPGGAGAPAGSRASHSGGDPACRSGVSVIASTAAAASEPCYRGRANRRQQGGGTSGRHGATSRAASPTRPRRGTQSRRSMSPGSNFGRRQGQCAAASQLTVLDGALTHAPNPSEGASPMSTSARGGGRGCEARHEGAADAVSVLESGGPSARPDRRR